MSFKTETRYRFEATEHRKVKDARTSLLPKHFIIKMAVKTWGVTSVAQRFRQTPSFSKITLALRL